MYACIHMCACMYAAAKCVISSKIKKFENPCPSSNYQTKQTVSLSESVHIHAPVQAVMVTVTSSYGYSYTQL